MPDVDAAVAGNPAALKASILRYWYCYPFLPTFFLVCTILSGILAYFFHYSFVLSALLFLISLGFLLSGVRSGARAGDLGAAMVVSTSPYLIAVYREMRKMPEDAWPAIVIARAPLQRAVDKPYPLGRVLPVVCTYNDLAALRHWDDIRVRPIATLTNRLEVVHARAQRMETPGEGTHKLQEHLGKIPQPYRPGIYFLRPGAPFGLNVEGWHYVTVARPFGVYFCGVAAVLFAAATAWLGWVWLLQGSILMLFALGFQLVPIVGKTVHGDIAPGIVVSNSPTRVAYYADLSRTPDLWLPVVRIERMPLHRIPHLTEVGTRLPVVITLSPRDDVAGAGSEGPTPSAADPTIMALQVSGLPAAFFSADQTIVDRQLGQIDPRAWQLLDHALPSFGPEFKPGIYPLRIPGSHWTDELVEEVQKANEFA